MLDQKRNLFRKESLERLSSPERLDQLIQVVSPRSWLPLTSLGLLVSSALIWSIFGRIPITIEGRGVLVYPSKVIAIQSDSSGQLVQLNFKAGDTVKKGDILAVIDQSKVQKQLQQQRLKLASLMAQDQAVASLQNQEDIQEKRTITQQRLNAQQQIHELQTLTPILREKSRESIAKQTSQLQQRMKELEALVPILQKTNRENLQEQRKSFQQRIQAAKAQLPLLQKRVESRRSLLEQKVISDDTFVQAQEEYLRKVEDVAQLETQLKELEVRENDSQEKYINNLNEIASIRSQLQKLEVDETNAEQSYLNNLNQIAKLQADLKTLDSQEANTAKQNLQEATQRTKEIQEVKSNIAQLELELQKNSQIISQYSGRILEITVNPGEVISAGNRLASIDAENPNSKLVGISYFAIADGKKIQPGMQMQITPQTVKRERFGGIVGNVTNVSSFPITKEAVAKEVGNPELAAGLISEKQDGVMQIFANLELDPKTASGYKWSSSAGPQLKISSGTTTMVRVTVEERAPITFVLPILRSVSGIY
ncbi:NHLP bacteriocin system secretion protein [Aliinostoc sp. HNIBRCY26]|uniref:NHLP bacteriocin system secretion protein n=1 Tax=Aliinostoc sp. HNIBRCY26 TaxID=3418997 RepID=UPI003CFD64A6